ncbi:MAG: MBL fold metallo-hydrolase [Tannerellaceae bacterium]|nr:MBL fold metallo-hydrolase [Tannerellaceae bacterium]
MQIELIDIGYFYADGGAMFGAIPKTAWSKRYPSDETNSCLLAMNCLLVRTGNGRIILIDNGAGTKPLKKLSYYRFFNLRDLLTVLKEKGISREQITDVVLTHLHFDHCGYTTLQDSLSGALSLAFPGATHWISREQWVHLENLHPLEKESCFRENVELLADSPSLKLIEKKTSISPEITLDLFDGHTSGQLVPYIKTPGQTYVFAGDVLPLAACISPEWISAYDTYPLISYHEKCRLLEDAAQKNHAIIFCHDAYIRCATVKKINDFYKIAEKINISESAFPPGV